MRWIGLAAIVVLSTHGGASANAWKDNFVRFIAEGAYVKSEGDPEKTPSTGDLDTDFGEMYRKGLVPIGYSFFESGNDQTRDGERWAKELGASHVIFGVDLQSTRNFAVPLTVPNTTTSTTNGTATAFGSGGTVFGNFNATTTTTGTRTSWLPVTKNRFAKSAVYFAPEPMFGAGIYTRQVSPEEMQALGTRFAIAVRFVRDFSPAYYADILPGDVILKVNGKPAEPSIWWSEILDDQPDNLEIVRGDKAVKLVLVIPQEWRTLPSQPGEGEK
ncbi:MAG: PDZ domain-containing protein [Erythrobacter sp.]|jgi:hypothetical protein|nr:PDZ domain-containing protein [Erythrobacter sp.]